MRFSIPSQLKEYIKIKDNEIVFKNKLPEELKIDFENFKKEFEVSKAMFKSTDEFEPKPLSDEEKEFDNYCKLYEGRFGKKAYIAEPSGTKGQTINAIKLCLEKNEDLLDKLLYPNLEDNLNNGILYSKQNNDN